MELYDSALITIRPAAEADLPQILSIEQSASPAPWTHALFIQEFGNARACNLVAEGLPGMVRGFIFCAIASDELSINNLAVHASFRRMGIARRLLEAAFAQAWAQGAAKAFLEVRSKNNAAIALYAKAGFAIQAVRKKYYADDEDDGLLMMRPLGPVQEKS